MTVNIKIPKDASKIIEILNSFGFGAYVVGGCVRDSLMNNVPNDWDICTAAKPEEVKRMLCSFYPKIIDTGIKHGTITVITNDDSYEITTYRIDGEYEDNRHPKEVTYTSDLLMDLSRRDFTINSMAYHPEKGLMDFFGGESDLKDGLIECVGNPMDRFKEDGLRILRALRFASRFGFSFETDTERAIHLSKDLLDNISKERISSELTQILMGDGAETILHDFSEVFEKIIPDIGPCVGFNQFNKKWHYLQVWDHMARSVAMAPKDEVIRLTMFLHDIGKPKSFIKDEDGVGHFYGHASIGKDMAYDILRDLKYDNCTISSVVSLIEYHDQDIAPTEKSVKRLLNKFNEEWFRNLLKVKRADALAQVNPEFKIFELNEIEKILDRIIQEEQCFSLKSLQINGKDLLDLGMEPGPGIGRILNKILDSVISGEVNNERKELLKLSKEVLEILNKKGN